MEAEDNQGYRRPLLIHQHHHDDDDDYDSQSYSTTEIYRARAVPPVDIAVDIDTNQCYTNGNGNTSDQCDNNNNNGKFESLSNKEGEMGLDISSNEGENESESRNGNPFSFIIGDRPLSLGSPCSIDPFRNHTPNIDGVYEWVKIFVCIPLALLRLVLFGLVLFVGFLATKLALQGWKDKRNPMPKWRCRLMFVTRLCCRSILFCFGELNRKGKSTVLLHQLVLHTHFDQLRLNYHWIRRSGQPASREIAPIVVSNHVSYTDPIFFFYELFPSIVASESHDDIPFVGTIIRAMQVIYVNRFSPVSRKLAIDEIKRKASCNDFPRVMLFPEGTTTNGRSLLSFQLGAFVPGFPIQPVIIRYPHVHFDQSWGTISLLKLMFRMFTQFHNFMEVEYLPVIFPMADKKESPVHLSKKVSYAMSRALNVVQTHHSYGDLMLAQRASEMGMEPASAYMVEMAKLERPFRLSTAEAIGFLERFAAMDPDHSGRVKLNNFLMVLGLGKNQFSEQIFQFIDMQREGAITFREFLFVSTYILKQPNFHLLCDMAFKSCDINNKGFLLRQEVEMAARLVAPDLSEENVCQIFKLFDVDNDSRVGWDDFRTCLERNPVLISLFGPQVSSDGFL